MPSEKHGEKQGNMGNSMGERTGVEGISPLAVDEEALTNTNNQVSQIEVEKKPSESWWTSQLQLSRKKRISKDSIDDMESHIERYFKNSKTSIGSSDLSGIDPCQALYKGEDSLKTGRGSFQRSNRTCVFFPKIQDKTAEIMWFGA